MNTAAKDSFSEANPHALATILEASQTRSIIASRDIFDISGTKLWARDQPVSQALQRKLLDRRLRQPIETCLMAEDGVTAHTLVEGAEALLAGGSALAELVRPHAARLQREAAQLPLHAVAQLLLTAGQATRPQTFEHALQAMVLAGALMCHRGGGTPDIRAAMAAGLLHDLGEMYIAPEYMRGDGIELDFQGYKHLVVHPHVGSLLLSQLTNYPAVIARAVGEHHERLDGSGYPRALKADALSALGRLLAGTEAAVALLRGDAGSAARASVALRVVPGEFDLHWAGPLADAARRAAAVQDTPTPELRERLGRVSAALEVARGMAAGLRPDGAASEALTEAFGLAAHLLDRLAIGWNACGLWHAAAVAETDAAEVHAVAAELMYRLRGIERVVRLRAGDLPDAEQGPLDSLCMGLRACTF